MEPVEPSLRSAVEHSANQLRDPFVFVDGENAWLVYVVAGESGLAIGRLEERGAESARSSGGD